MPDLADRNLACIDRGACEANLEHRVAIHWCGDSPIDTEDNAGNAIRLGNADAVGQGVFEPERRVSGCDAPASCPGVTGSAESDVLSASDCFASGRGECREQFVARRAYAVTLDQGLERRDADAQNDGQDGDGHHHLDQG